MITLASHHLHIGNEYPRHEKWVVFGIMLAVTIAIWAMNVSWFESAPASANTIVVEKVTTPPVVGLDSNGGKTVAISLIDKKINQPANGTWVGLRVKDPTKRSDSFTYQGWYSPLAGRAFYPTNDAGLVYFPLNSTVAGPVEYEVFVGNPELKTSGRYRDLGYSFVVEYK